MTVIWINIMITTSTHSKQDNIFDCCQGLQFDHVLILGNLWNKSETREKLGGLLNFVSFMLFFHWVFTCSEPNNKR